MISDCIKETRFCPLVDRNESAGKNISVCSDCHHRIHLRRIEQPWSIMNGERLKQGAPANKN